MAENFALVDTSEGRTAGYVATRVNASLRLRLASPASLRSGFFSLGFERSYRNHAVATITCDAPCQCAQRDFDAHGSKKYYYTQRSEPLWVTIPQSGALTTGGQADAAAECNLRVRLKSFQSYRVMLNAITFSAPNAQKKAWTPSNSTR